MHIHQTGMLFHRFVQKIRFLVGLDLKKIYKSEELLWIIFGQLGSLILGFGVIKLLTKMSPGEFGLYSLILTISALVSAILFGPAEQGFLRYYFEFKKKGLLETFFQQILKFILFATIFLLVLTIPASIFLKDKLQIVAEKRDYLFYFLTTFFVVLTSASTISSSFLNLFRERKINAKYQILERAISLTLLILIVYTFGIDLFKVILSLCITLIIVLLFKFKTLKNYIVPNHTTVSPDELKVLNGRLLFFCLPFVVWGITGWLQNSSDKWIISSNLSLAEVGVFALLSTVSNYLIAMPIGLFTQFISPIMLSKSIEGNGDQDQKTASRIFKQSIVFCSVYVLFISTTSIYWADLILKLISNSQYILPQKYLLGLLCLGGGIFQIAQILTVKGIIHDKPSIYLIPKILSGCIAVILNIILIKHNQILGIAIAMCITSICYLFLVLIVNLIGLRNKDTVLSYK